MKELPAALINYVRCLRTPEGGAHVVLDAVRHGWPPQRQRKRCRSSILMHCVRHTQWRPLHAGACVYWVVWAIDFRKSKMLSITLQFSAGKGFHRKPAISWVAARGDGFPLFSAYTMKFRACPPRTVQENNQRPFHGDRGVWHVNDVNVDVLSVVYSSSINDVTTSRAWRIDVNAEALDDGRSNWLSKDRRKVQRVRIFVVDNDEEVLSSEQRTSMWWCRWTDHRRIKTIWHDPVSWCHICPNDNRARDECALHLTSLYMWQTEVTCRWRSSRNLSF